MDEQQIIQPEATTAEELVLESKVFYQCDYDWRYIGEVLAWESPEDKRQGGPHMWLNPLYSVELPPPPPQDGKNIYYVPSTLTWEYRDIPVPEPEPEPPLPTPAEIVAANTAMRDRLLNDATRAIAPLQDAVDLEMATDTEKALLTEWKRYRVFVNRVDLTVENPNWPVKPQ